MELRGDAQLSELRNTMMLIPLIDRTGITKAWADRQTGWISDLTGKVFALVAFDGVFDRTGTQIGWWQGDYIADRFGRVVLSKPRVKIDNVTVPQPRQMPRRPPHLHLPLAHPTLRWLLMPPLKSHRWADFTSFLDGLGHTQTAAEKLRAFRERIGRADEVTE
jgi:hypothetical protein